MKILNNVDLNQNQVKYALLHPTGTVPSDPKKGQVYFNTSSNKLFVWDGSGWIDCTSQGHAFETNTSNIKMNGTVSVGSLNTISRADHVHPSDTSKVTANNAITGGTKCKITYDSKGLVTAGADLEASDIPDLSSTYALKTTVDNHISNTSNPHSVTKSQVGLSNVTNDAQVKRDEMGAANGVATLDTDAKVPLSQLPDAILGQLIYGGTVVPSTAVATLTANAKSKLGTTSSTITLVNSAGTKTSQTGWVANEGIYYIASGSGTFLDSGLSFESGDWLISNGVEWTKIDTSDAVTGVKGNAESTYRRGNVNITAANIGAATTADLANKMDKVNPTGTGSFSLNRKEETTIGNYSFAEGYNTTASGMYSHAEGSNTVASGHRSHAEGGTTTASGNYSHAEGFSTTATGGNSHVEGYGTIAVKESQHVFGEYNEEDTGNNPFSRDGNYGNYIEIVGNGTGPGVRSNARTLDWGGNEELAGNLKAAGLTDGITTKTMSQVLSAPRKITAAIDQASQTLSGDVSNWAISNTIGSVAVIVQVRDSAGNVVLPDINITLSTITISIVSATKLADDSYYATIIG